MYEREAIIVHLLKQKDEQRAQDEQRRADETAEQEKEERRKKEEQRESERRAEQAQFVSVEAGSQEVGTRQKEDDNGLNFWVPGSVRATMKKSDNHNHTQLKRIRASDGGDGNGDGQTEGEGGKKKRKKQHQKKTVCPVLGTPLRLKNLISITPKKAPSAIATTSTATASDRDEESGDSSSNDEDDDDDDEKGEDGADNVSKSKKKTVTPAKPVDVVNVAMFICPLCQTALTNASKPVALRTGSVLCAKCVDSFVKKEQRDPITGKEIDITCDVILINNSGTGFVGSTDDPNSKIARIYKPSMT